MRLFPMPDQTACKRIYEDLSYFNNPEFYDIDNGNLYGYVDYIAERIHKQRDYQPIAEFLRDRHGGAQLPDSHEVGTKDENTRPSLLDVGCGLGYLLDVARDVGFDVSGIEFNPQAVRAMREEFTFPVHGGGLDSFPERESAFDVVTMFDVIEHLHDPFASIQKIHRLLRPGGGLAISTMDSESSTSRLLGRRLEDFRRTREHLFFFSRETLTKVLELYGFRVYKISSYGHTFEFEFLLDRLAIYNRPIFRSIKWLANRFGLGKRRISIDFRTKMIVYAQKPFASS
jgi:SAM-dependent methyltransferase